jgi:erythromycin esterase-like protein
MKTTIDMTREAGGFDATPEFLKRFEALVRADERMSFYGQDKPAECADGCPPNQICDYCQVVAPAKAMILAEREACAKIVETPINGEQDDITMQAKDRVAAAIRARGKT